MALMAPLELAHLGAVVRLGHPGGQVTARGDLVRGRGHLLERGQAPADQPPPADREQQDQRAPRDQLGDDDAADLARWSII